MDEPNRLGARPETRPASPAHSEAKSSEGRQAGVARRSPAELAERALEGEQSAGARLIRLLENQERDGIEGLKALYPHGGRAHIVGITGPPGAGKSTLVDALIAEWRRRERRVAVIAVDPSSPFSGGAILGDRVRMQRHATAPGVFIRSMATRGQLGGLARTSFEASAVLDAMGYDVILVETVGVGQDELDVVELAHTTAVVNVPGLGDHIQAIKAGILEVGDLFILNKADRPGADETEKQLRLMLHLREGEERDAGFEPPLLRTVAPRGDGIVEVVDACTAHYEHLSTTGGIERKTAVRGHRFLVELVRELASEAVFARAAAGELAQLVDDVRARRTDPYSAAERLVAAMLKPS